MLAAWAGGALLAARYVGQLQGALEELTTTVDAQASEIRRLRALVVEVEERRRSARERASERRKAEEEGRRTAERWSAASMPGDSRRRWPPYGNEHLYSSPWWGGGLADDVSASTSAAGSGMWTRRRGEIADPPAPSWPTLGDYDSPLGASWEDLYYGPDSRRARPTEAAGAGRKTPSRGSGKHVVPPPDPQPQVSTRGAGKGIVLPPSPLPLQQAPPRGAGKRGGAPPGSPPPASPPAPRQGLGDADATVSWL